MKTLSKLIAELAPEGLSSNDIAEFNNRLAEVFSSYVNSIPSMSLLEATYQYGECLPLLYGAIDRPELFGSPSLSRIFDVCRLLNDKIGMELKAI